MMKSLIIAKMGRMIDDEEEVCQKVGKDCEMKTLPTSGKQRMM